MSRSGAADTALALGYERGCTTLAAVTDVALASSWTLNAASITEAGISQRPSHCTARSVPRLIKLRTPDSDMPTISATSRGRYATRLRGRCECSSCTWGQLLHACRDAADARGSVRG